ncbi:stage III sporulation protein AF [Clostridium gasigenes]|uniref:Stage III sporulation protein AF n=1 Tax=Clostridium gasigenes TaxID=94869 RepID=A0A1H0MYJ6_9CLOT|nr:stage III sporulation protein AF [Clostridium gasigenes]MBB6625179.1 stage III sporulation protein AF [Clostridium gasigenes]MBB6716183.1 stage III sporulation protein AF [Clostridium gasigenes]MBU3087371.1 stage III sporulation protein AF [Clostridium gasigenes]SDO85539.1 stage III sporulation protein AF [Clostridium gasigenes]
MESISAFITTLVTTIILMTAVELIAPDNSIKKYINFVLGLILISVMLTPIVSLFSKGETKVINEINRYEKEFVKMDKNEDKGRVDRNREESFKNNLNKNCNKLLEEEFKGREFESDISCNIDIKNMTYDIDKVKIGVKDDSIKKIQKIEINRSDSSAVIGSQTKEEEVNGETEIKIYLEQILNIKAKNIEIYKQEK